jgi:hypothetical protein
MFGNQSIKKRVGRAVVPFLEPGEQLVVPVFLHTYGSLNLAAMLQGTGVVGDIRTWIVALTNRRVLLFQGDSMNAARSRLLGAVPRSKAHVTYEGSPAKPTHLTLTVSGGTDDRFAVPVVWRKDVAELVRELGAPPAD